MKFITIEADKQKLDLLDVPQTNPYEATSLIGLPSMRTDTGHLQFEDRTRVLRPFCIIVYEYGLVEKHHRFFFALGRNLYQGNALLYRYDDEGETKTCTEEDLELIRPHLRWLIGRDWVEAAILNGQVSRPEQSVTTLNKDGSVAQKTVTWRWEP